MPALVPAFVGGMPGGAELLVIFIIMLLLFGVPVALAVVLGYRYLNRQSGTASTDDRIEALESELETLKRTVNEHEGSTEPRDERSTDEPNTDERNTDERSTEEPPADRRTTEPGAERGAEQRSVEPRDDGGSGSEPTSSGPSGASDE